MTALRRLLVVMAALALVLSACSDDDGDEGADETPSSEERDESGIDDLEAEARTAAVEYFEAFSVLDYAKAMDRSSGSASLVVQWAESVNDIDQVAGTPYEFVAAPSDEITVSIDSVAENGDAWSATGFVELRQRPPGMAEGTLPPETEVPPESWFITDLTYTRDGDRLRLDDYRLDDVPYPVSDLLVDYGSVDATVVVDDREAAGSTTTTGGATTTGASGTEAEGSTVDDMQLHLGHRDVDGSVQYYLTESVDDLELGSASFIAPTDGGPPPPGLVGDPVELLVDEPTTADPPTTADADADTRDGDDGEPVLAVRPGAFPGGAGTLRVVFTDEAGTAVLVLDLAVPDFPPLEQRPVNEVRNTQTTTTTSSTSTTTTSTTTPDATVTVPTSLAPPPTTAPPTTATPPTSTTTTASP